MKLLRHALRGWPSLTIATLATNLYASASTTGLLVFLLHITSNTMPVGEAIILFCVIAVGTLGGYAAGYVLLRHLIAQVTADSRETLAHRILAAPLVQIEALGAARIDTALIQDTSAMAEALISLAQFLIGVTAVVVGIGYLCWIQPVAVMIIGAAIFIGLPVYWLLQRRAIAAGRRFAQAFETLIGNLSILSSGLKELKLHRERRHHFLDVNLVAAIRELRTQNTNEAVQWSGSLLWGQALAIATVAVFVFGSIDGSGANARAAIIVIYLLNPLQLVLASLSTLARGDIALERIDDLYRLLDHEMSSAKPNEHADINKIGKITYADLTYRYPESDGKHGFSLGPVSLSIHAGGITFLTGGNGSGKTTLLKLIVGLYRSENGEIRVDDHIIRAQDYERFRTCFTAIFDDYHLFDEVLPYAQGPGAPDPAAIIRQLELDRVVSLNGQRFSSTQLSRGQRKRLALINALLDDRPVYIFDEWAADQDPRFKKIFYRHILPSLKQRGKAVFAITHDEQYFDAADYIISLSDGRIKHTSNLIPHEQKSSFRLHAQLAKEEQ